MKPPKLYKNSTIIILLFFFFPIGLYLMWRYSPWVRNTKIVITCLYPLLYLSSIFPFLSFIVIGLIVYAIILNKHGVSTTYYNNGNIDPEDLSKHDTTTPNYTTVNIYPDSQEPLDSPPKNIETPIHKTILESHISSDLPQDSMLLDEQDNSSVIHNVEKIDTKRKEHHKVSGTSFKQSEIKSLGEENEIYTWTKREIIDNFETDHNIYQLCFPDMPVELIEEPDNEYDSNAIKVVVNEIHIGYIKKGSCSHIKNLIKANKIVSITSDIYGGKFKRVSSDYDFDKDKDIYDMEKGETDFFASIYIELKD